MKKEIIKRNSGFELLRIICMFLIIAHHYFEHGGYDSMSAENITSGYIFIQCLSMFGRLACSMFAMISGYYMIRSTRKNYYRKIVPLIAEMLFYSILVWIIAYYTEFVPVTLISGMKAFFGNWFVAYYIILYMLIPYINPMIEALQKKQFTQLIFAMLLIWCVMSTLSAGALAFSAIDFFLVMYFLGAYIRMYGVRKMSYNNKWNLLIGLGCAALLVLSVVVFDFIGVWVNNDAFITKATYFGEYYSMLAVPCAIFTFLYFSNLNFSSRIVNITAKSMIGVYLLHDNKIMRTIIWEIFWPNADYANNPYFHAITKIVVVFVVCLLIDMVRRGTVGYVFDTWFYRHCDSMVEWLKKMMPEKIKEKIQVWL